MIEVDEQQLEIFRLRGQVYDLSEALRLIAQYPAFHHMTDGGDAGHKEMAELARAALAKCKEAKTND